MRQTFRLQGSDTVINKLNCVALIGLIVGLNAIGDARAETNGGIKLNETAVVFATEQIKQGAVVAMAKVLGSNIVPQLSKRMNLFASMDSQSTPNGIWASMVVSPRLRSEDIDFPTVI